MNLNDKKVEKIIEMLDEKYKQTKSEKYEVLFQELQLFKLNQEDGPEGPICLDLLQKLVNRKILNKK